MTITTTPAAGVEQITGPPAGIHVRCPGLAAATVEPAQDMPPGPGER
jgi:hypothetical protein